MSWSKRLRDPSAGDFSNWRNPFDFYNLLMMDDIKLYNWLQQHNLIASSMRCELCARPCKLVSNSAKKGGKVWRCKGGITWKHDKTYSVHHHSIFERSQFDVRELLVFIQEWALGSSLHRCAIESGLNYKRTSVDWANFLRDLMRKFVDDIYYGGQEPMLAGHVEIDESLFGRRRCKFHRGDPRGQKIWILGMVERSTNRIILYPVDSRNENTLIPLIERHVEKGATIYTDGWRAYSSLNDRGYRHFTVEHKSTFVQVYQDVATGEETVVHTNTIEGSWKIAKEHFRKINGTSINNFEGHLSEIIWKNRVIVGKENILEAMFSLITTYYTLHRKPSLEVHHEPLFDSWSAKQTADKVFREDEAGNHSSDQPSTGEASTGVPEEASTHSEHGPSTSYRLPRAPAPASPTAPAMPALDPCAKRQFGSPEQRVSKARKPAGSPASGGKKKPKKTTRTGTLCHPPGFRPLKIGKEVTVGTKQPAYTKSDFEYDWSSDSDFE
ncbi:uncharacterized protein [Diadema setosum]|uniref:uncharacterized protein n=1 Tax=Diadema setosum TaxID=31175 RepID=UPI003B3A002E